MTLPSQSKNSPIVLAVVGHTNTGKTSLLRTLLRDSQFGEIHDAAGTTRHVEAAQLSIQGRPVLELRDTPGLEDSLALQAVLDQLHAEGHQGRAALEQLIQQKDHYPEFEQEIKVLKQALACAALLYVIDSRDEVLEKYRQELHSLSLAARPILPVLNFVHAPGARREAWRTALAELRLHALVEFDTVAFDHQAEQRLYQKLQTLLEDHYQTLQQVVEHRAQQWQMTRRAGIEQVVCLLMTVAGQVRTVEPDHIDTEAEALQTWVREQEQHTLNTVLEVLQFADLAVQFPNLPVNNGQWQMDLFAPETLKTFGLDTATAAATGAAIGVGVDLMLAGMSLGAATATGAALGAAWQTGRRYGRDLLTKVRGYRTLAVDDTTLTLLLFRQLWLLRTLFQRGHAAQQSITMESSDPPKTPEGWPEQLSQLRKLRSPVSDGEQTRIKESLVHWMGSAL